MYEPNWENEKEPEIKAIVYENGAMESGEEYPGYPNFCAERILVNVGEEALRDFTEYWDEIRDCLLASLNSGYTLSYLQEREPPAEPEMFAWDLYGMSMMELREDRRNRAREHLE